MKYLTIAGDLAEMHPSVTWKRVCEAVYRRLVGLDNPGFCLHCGVDADGVGADARHYVAVARTALSSRRST